MKNRIRVLRAERRMSQADLAEIVGVSRQAINAIENCKHEPTLPLGFRIAKALGVDIQEVFDPDDDHSRGKSGKAD